MPNWGRLGENLIFVISQPRSGSTLLQKILASHPAIHTVSEPWIALHPLFGLRERGIAADYGSRLALVGVRDFLGGLPEGEQAYYEGVRRMLGYLYSSALRQSGKRIFLDKTPRYYLILPELRAVFPRARFVFLLRNPVAVLASVIDTWAPDDCPACLHRFRHDLAVAPKRILEAIGAAQDECAVIRYEDLAADPRKSVARLCKYLRIPFRRSMIEYGASAAGQGYYRFGDLGTVYQESRPVAERIDRWRQTMTSPLRQAWARGYIETLGPETITSLGYDAAELGRTFPPQPGFEGAWAEIVSAAASHRNAPA